MTRNTPRRVGLRPDTPWDAERLGIQMTERTSWLSEEGGVAIEDHARRLTSFMEAMADGIISKDELAEQEERVVALMKAIEPKLDDALHAEVTGLLCELTAYDIMKLLGSMQEARTKTTVKG